MDTADLVESRENGKRACGLVASLGVNESDWNTLLKDDVEISWGIRGAARVIGQLPHVIWWSVVGILEDTSFVGAVSQAIYRVLMID